MAGSLAVQKDLRPITISDCAGLGCWSSASVRHLLTCLATSCLGFLSLLDETSLGFPPPLLPLQFCMSPSQAFSQQVCLLPRQRDPRGRAWCPQARCGLALCALSPLMRTGLEPHRSSSEVTAWGHTSCWDEGRAGGEERWAVGWSPI